MDSEARDRRAKLYGTLYDELHRLAQTYMKAQPGRHTLQATALVNEAYLKLFEKSDRSWEDRGHFFSLACVAMRQILVDHARAKSTAKRGGAAIRTPLDAVVVSYEDRALDLIALDEALVQLKDFDPVMARAVDLRFFGGLDNTQAARHLGMSKRTLERRWTTVRSWLYARLK